VHPSSSVGSESKVRHDAAVRHLQQEDLFIGRQSLQGFGPCLHDAPYIVEFITSHRSNASSTVRVSVFLTVEGEELEYVETSTAPISLGQVIKTSPLYLYSRPQLLRLVGGNDPFGYRQIALLHGGETTTVIDSGNGLEIGINDFWVFLDLFAENRGSSLQHLATNQTL